MHKLPCSPGTASASLFPSSILNAFRWDITIALLSRRQPCIPTAFLDRITEFHDRQSWDFFTLYGCPIEFVRTMAHLAKLASIYEKTKTMEWTFFDTLPVDIIIEEVSKYKNPEALHPSDLEDDQNDLNAQQHRYLCIEAWRHAILLYALRVFNATQDASGLRKIDYHARMILDAVRCIPESDFTQKQVLLPVFLAGAEAGAERDRIIARSYCTYWDTKSRFGHFDSAEHILEDIWSGWSEDTRSWYWWGSKIAPNNASQSADPDAGPLTSEILLG